jgi:hypothetical protein
MTLRNLLIGALGALIVAPAASAANLLTNGDFEAGNTGFYSSYTYMVADFWDPEVYGIDDDPQDGHSLFSSFGDHTTGQGLMMVLNGSQAEDVVVWGAGPVSVAQNTNYTFSFWLASVHPQSPAILAPRINGMWQSPTANASGTTGVWTNFSYVWNSGANTQATVELINRNLAFSGNDFALDDMSFGAVPEPATWAMMIMGFGAAGALLRRRRAFVAA